ncbi:MAG: UDP-glucose/GDP-mannose dehydrogenase family protein [Nitrospinota bacterium]|nr:UDP-glucose/GDP-mannose dehydrogenase family protein [Nitrospinota bacterium]
MRICVIGTGYVGLVTGAVFADLGNDVYCVDVDAEKVSRLSKGIMPIYEPGLEEMVKRNLTEGRICFHTDVGEYVRRADIIFICVGTPSKNEGETDLSQVESAAKDIGKNINGYKVVVNKSTVPVGTGDLVRRIINENEKTRVEFDVVSNPEFLREGSAIADALNPDRIVIGAPSKNVAMKLIELYATLGAPMYITDVVSAELIKYASNSYLATKISFINAIADLCELAGANITDVARAVGADKRIGKEFLFAGLGYGGSCFPKDIASLEHTARKLGYEFGLLRSVMHINDIRAHKLVSKVDNRFKTLEGHSFAVLGLSFKPNTDDLREAKSLEIIETLVGKGAKVKAYDPVAMEKAREIFPHVDYVESPYDAAEGASALILVTEWREFLSLDMERLKKIMKSPVIFDGRNIYDMEKLKGLGFEYHGMGRH